ncbi:equilibrative nucleotide transporter 3-like [Tripterygium wilfordii]|uniref:equilibrative nucleotide transporter 3-like n=1 Tax=Tripterygium wilfordii TaxID=458696 RepID=UPI0018F82502|nr:equilibrative nucleotide transporter 3-like [Tripterygium wilfordii]
MTTIHESRAPDQVKGKYAAIIVCWVLGAGCLFAWNVLFTIQDYYGHLFPRYHPSRLLTLAYVPFFFGVLAALAYNEEKINTRRRNLIGFTLFFIGSLLLLVLDLATSGKGGLGTFIGICIISSSFGVGGALAEGGMVGDLSLMKPEFIQSFSAGLAASGVIMSSLRLITKAAFKNSNNGLRKGAILFFAIAAFLELVCVFLYAFIFPRLPIVKYYRSKAASQGSKTVSADLVAGGLQEVEEDTEHLVRLSVKELLYQNIDYALDIFLSHLLTLSIFPGFIAEDTGSHSLGQWYVPVLIATNNGFDFVGRYIPMLRFLKLESRKGLMIFTLLRFLFIPAFYFTAKYGDQGWMIMLTAALGITQGYLIVSVLTSAPKGYKGPEQNALGNLLTLSLALGVGLGVACDFLWLIGKGW